MEICGQYFSRETLGRIEAELELEPGISRRELSRRVCEWLDWRAPNGKLRDMSCRKALLQLQARGAIPLPPVEATYGFQRSLPWEELPLPPVAEVANSQGGGKSVAAEQSSSCSLGDLGEVEVLPVSSRFSEESRIWKGMMARYHPLGAGPLCGAQVRYVVRSAAHGWLGGLSFSGATWRLKDRDRWIGWSEGARRAHLQEVANSQSSRCATAGF